VAISRRENVSGDRYLSKVESCPLGKRFPDLLEFLTLSRWPDGEERLPGGLSVFLNQGMLKACLRDPSSSSVCFVSAKSLTELLACLDKVSGGVEGDWRTDTFSGNGSRKRS
jgi:hypothetical protein